jgi:hypothetical protein
MVRGVREFQEDFRDDRRRDEERSDSRREDQRRDEMMRAMEESDRQRREDERKMNALRTIVNDDDIEITLEERKLINDPSIKMMENGEVVKRRASKSKESPFAKQFSGLKSWSYDKLPKVKKKVKSKARKELNKLQSKAFEEANKILRTKSGKLRKGVSQSDVAKKAQKILKRLRK